MKKIYFFNGWGMDENILNNISNSTEYHLEIVNYPYNLNLEEIQANEENIFIAWSFGVYYLNKFLNENQVNFSKTIAINGVPEFLGNFGINLKMFDLTLKTLNPENLLKFYNNMDIDKNFQSTSKDINELKKELEYFKENYRIFKNKIAYYIIGKYDRIVPRLKQEKFCKEIGANYKLIESGHYPFIFFKDFKDIIS